MFDVIAHRGASKEAPENTLSSLKRAIEIGADYLEIDVHLSKDGVPVVIHDAFLGRTTNGRPDVRITDLTLAEIKALDAGALFDPRFAGERIPTLEEVLNLDRGPTGLMIEIKKGHSPIRPLVTSILADLAKAPHNSQGEIVVGSFSTHILEELQQKDPAIPLIGIAEDFNMIPILRSMNLPRMAFWYKLLNPALVQALHEDNIKVWTFTVDDPKVAAFLISIKLDGIITNEPQTMKQLSQRTGNFV